MLHNYYIGSFKSKSQPQLLYFETYISLIILILKWNNKSPKIITLFGGIFQDSFKKQ